MIFFEVFKEKNSPALYKQIYMQLKDMILNHSLSKHEKIPSKRKLAEDLGVSVNSVAHAYEQLLAEGYIYSIERKGYMVEDIVPYIKKDGERNPFPEDLKENEQTRSFFPDISFSHIATDVEHFPFMKWRKFQQQVIEKQHQSLASLPDFQGPYEVRETIATMVALTRGVRCRAEQIVIGSGTQPLIHKLMGMQNEQGHVAVETPGYQRFYRLLKNMEFPVTPIPLDNQGISVERIREKNPRWVFVTPSHQFPTGIIMPVNRRIELLNWAAESPERYIVEDDYDSEFKYGTDNIPALQSLDRNRQVIYTGTFSKTLWPSLRISYMILPPKLLRMYRDTYGEWIDGPSTLSLQTLKHFIDEGEYGRHLKRMNAYYKTKRTKLINELKRVFENQITIHNVPAGLHFLVEVNTNLNYEEIETEAKNEGVQLYTLRRFMLGEDYSGFISNRKKYLIIGFANMKDEFIELSVRKLHSILKIERISPVLE